MNGELEPEMWSRHEGIIRQRECIKRRGTGNGLMITLANIYWVFMPHQTLCYVLCLQIFVKHHNNHIK